MRATLVVCIIACILSCDEDNDGLSRVCPNPRPCVMRMGQVSVVDLTPPMGVCKVGMTACDENNAIRDCVGYVGPSLESCDGLDNDCDGQADEGFDVDGDGFLACFGDCVDTDPAIHPGMLEACNDIDDDCDYIIDSFERPCWTGPAVDVTPPAICREGHMLCEVGSWGPCLGQILPVNELCDGLDNDCDGLVDEPVKHACGTNDVGSCVIGDLVCASDDQVCVNAIFPTVESCNSADDDCDGHVDEDLVRVCSTICGRGQELCQAGAWIDCDALVPVVEVCDSVDNDCDGLVDEGCICALDDVMLCREAVIDRITGASLDCGVGVSICDAMGRWGPCYFLMIEEEVCDSWDNDCDGQADGLVEPCGDSNHAGIGVCQLGSRGCHLGVWSACVGSVVPTLERCNDADDDCDGLIDEGLNPHARADICFFIDGSGSMCPVISAVLSGISSYVADFLGSDHRFCLGVFPGVEPHDSIPGTPVLMLTGNMGNALVDITEMQRVLSMLTCSAGSLEPSYDVARDATDPADGLGIGWRAATMTDIGAYPYVIIVTDEVAQTWAGLTESQVAASVQNCAVGSCAAGDPFEIYVLTPPLFWLLWDEVTFFESDRLIDLMPADPVRYADVFRSIFANVCF